MNKALEKSFESFVKKLADNPDEIFDNDKLQKKYNILLKEKNKAVQELERYKNIIDELEKWLEDNIEYGDDDYYDMKSAGVESALNKLKELKGE